MDVVDVAVVVVVDVVVRLLARVAEDVRGQIGVIDLDSVVDHGDRDRRAALLDVPGAAETGVRVRDSGNLAGVLKMPLLREERIVGNVVLLQLLDEIGLRPVDEPALEEGLRNGEGIRPLGIDQPQHVFVCTVGKLVRDRETEGGQGVLDPAERETSLQVHNHLVGQ